MADDSKISILVLSIAANQFTVPLPTGKEVVEAVNNYGKFRDALEKIKQVDAHDAVGADHCSGCIARAVLAETEVK